MKMSLVVSLTLLVIALMSAGCDAKRDYFIEMENIIVTTPKDMDYVKIHAFRMLRFNMTATALNMSYSILQDLPVDLLMHGTAFELMPSGRYSMVPVKFPVWTLCKVIYEEKLLYPKMKAEGHLPVSCPVYKGEYWLHDFMIDADSMPERFPGTRWRGDIKLVTKGKTIFSVSVFVFLNRDVVF